jgi:hypothetical protein
MESVRKSIAEKRQNTDVSLGAERASANAVADKVARAQRLADDLVERERLLVDEQLRRFRDTADVVLADERLASTAPLSLVAPERMLSDRATMRERETNDAIIEHERQRSDDAIRAQREEHVTDAAEQARRADTDERFVVGVVRADTTLSTIEAAGVFTRVGLIGTPSDPAVHPGVDYLAFTRDLSFCHERSPAR